MFQIRLRIRNNNFRSGSGKMIQILRIRIRYTVVNCYINISIFEQKLTQYR